MSIKQMSLPICPKCKSSDCKAMEDYFCHKCITCGTLFGCL
ncbi:MAG: hypothetical protein ABIJ34_07250 [archaeon]